MPHQRALLHAGGGTLVAWVVVDHDKAVLLVVVAHVPARWTGAATTSTDGADDDRIAELVTKFIPRRRKRTRGGARG